MPLAAAPAGPASQSEKVSPARKGQLAEDYGKLPLSFEANRGQTDARVKFVARGSGYRLYLTAGGAVLTLGRGSAAHDVVRMQVVGASGGARAKAEPVGEEQLPGAVNYFVGNDAAGWHTGVPTYAKVRYTALYPGIDLVYYGNQRQLEYDFVVAPGADPKPVRLQFGGAKELHLAADGDLVVAAANGTLAFHKPQVYQVVEGRRQPVAGEFALLAKDSVGFRLGSYDHAKALTIDPVLVYSTYLGGSGGDGASAIAVDAAGNAYVAGTTYSMDFPVTPGALQTTSKGIANQIATAFVTKLNTAGTALVYSTYLGGSGIRNTPGDGAIGLAVDSLGNAYVTGYAYSTDFPVTAGALQTTNKAVASDGESAFVTKLNPTGTALVYSTYLGGSGGTGLYGASSGDQGIAIAADGTGNAYVTGQAVSADFPVTKGAFQTTNKGSAYTTFAAKLNPGGTALVYSTYLGGTGGEYVYGSAVDSGGNAYLVGASYSTDFPVTQGAFQTTNHNAPSNGYVRANAFVSKLNPAGTALVYSTYLGGSYDDWANGVGVDSLGNAYVGGTATSTDFPVTVGAFQLTNNGAAHTTGNVFVSKLNPAGTALVYSTYLGGSGGYVSLSPTLARLGGDEASNIAVDSFGDAYVAGSTASANFPVTAGAYQTTNNDQSTPSIGGYNVFVTELNPAGSSLLYSTFLGGSGINPYAEVGVIMYGEGDNAIALALDGSGNVYVTGGAGSGDFPVTQGAFQTLAHSGGNAFVAKLNPGAVSTATTPTVTITPSPTEVTSALPVVVTISVSGSGGAAPTGTVTLADGAYSSGAMTLSGGSATVKIPPASLYWASACLPPFANILTANYIPDAASGAAYKFSSGVSRVYDIAPCITVTPASSTLTWAQAQSQPLSVTVTIVVVTSYPGLPVPVGNVTLTAGGYTSAVATLNSAGATFILPAGTLSTGSNTLTAHYAGDSNYAPYTGSGTVTVGGVTVAVLPSSSTITTTQSLPVTITVSSASGSPTPTGTISMQSGNYHSPVTSLSGGSVTITIPAGALAVGIDQMVVIYDGNYAEAVGSATVTVTGPGWGFAIGGAPVSVARGAVSANTSTVTVTPAGGFAGVVALSAAITSSPAGAQDLPTLSFGLTSPVSITGAAATATLTISTTATTSAAMEPMPRGVPWYVAGDAALACVLFFGWPARRRVWRRGYGGLLGLVALLALVAGGLSACAGGSGGNTNPGTTRGTYIVTVTGTSGTTTGQGAITVTVQ